MVSLVVVWFASHWRWYGCHCSPTDLQCAFT